MSAIIPLLLQGIAAWRWCFEYQNSLIIHQIAIFALEQAPMRARRCRSYKLAPIGLQVQPISQIAKHTGRAYAAVQARSWLAQIMRFDVDVRYLASVGVRPRRSSYTYWNVKQDQEPSHDPHHHRF